MKLKNLYIIIIFILFIIIPDNTIIAKNTERYYDIMGSILKLINNECYEDIIDVLNINNNTNSSKYPWIIDYIGKGLNDLGDETECINSLVDTSYLLATIKTNYKNSNSKFLEIKSYSYGFCMTNKCKDTFKDKINIIWKFLNILFGDNKITDDEHMIEFMDEYEDKKKFNFIKYIIIAFLLYIILKIIIGILRMVFIPKGYNKYALDLLSERENFGSIDEEEQMNLSIKKDNLIILSEGNLNEYNPNYDFSSLLPIKLRILRYFDIFNDISLLTEKKNRYYNDDGLEIVAFMRFLVLFFLIFSETFNSLISLPSEDVFNDNFFKSQSIFLYKISINSFTCLIVLEGANTTYKLIKYINARMLEYDNNNNKTKFELKLLIVYIKFLFYFFPNLFIFLISYYFFYYKVEDFNYIISSQTTYKYIIEKIFKKNIECQLNPFPIFNNYTSFLSTNITDYCHCYEFTYFTFNILLSTLIFMIITYLSFLIRNKIFDIIILLINLFLLFFTVWIIKDPKVDTNNNNYLYYHFVGQKYSIKIIYSFIFFYYIGYILGFLLFYFDNNIKFKGYLNISLNNENKDEVEINNLDDSKIDKNEIKDYNLSYYPMSFLQKFISKLNQIKVRIRILIICICFSLIVLLSFVYQIIVYIHKKSIEIEFSPLIKLYFYYEKHLFIIFFFIITLLLNSLINKDSFIVNAQFIYLISRSGFTIICQYYFLSYFSLSTYFIRVKFHVLIFLLISVGNFIFFSIISFLSNVVFELPIKISISKLLRKINKSEKK